MILAVCIEDRGGMLFHRRRLSRDRAVAADLLREAGEGRLWISPYSLPLFPEGAAGLCPAEDFLERAGPGELCFVEDRPCAPWAGKAERLILYRWNRRYPADLYFDIPLESWRLLERTEFPGSSHKLLTKEVYLP